MATALHNLSDYDFNAVPAEHICEGVVLFARHTDVGNVVEQHAFPISGDEIFQFPSRPVQEYLPELADFGIDLDAHVYFSDIYG